MQDIHYDTLYQTEQYHWWYRVRREIINNFIVTMYPNQTDLRILDIGCGTGGLLLELGTYGTVDGIDFSEKAVAYCRAKGIERVSVGRIENIPREDNTFDLVISLDVLEHVERDDQAILEIKRVLKPGGRAIVAVPAYMFLWGVTDELSQHFRRYTQSLLAGRVQEAGLTLERSTYFNTILFPAIALIRILVRLLHIPLRSENFTGQGVINSLLYGLFHIESVLLRKINFPFGVSVLVIARK